MADIIIRKARREDCKEIIRLVQELADFEKMSDCVKITADTLEQDGFDSEVPAFQCLVVDDPENIKGNQTKLIGYALYNITYGTWEGKRYWLEDIMISEKYRRKGVGNKLFSALCKEAVKEGVVAIRFVVLKWNPATEFYKKLGMENITETKEWQYSKIDREDIIKAAGMFDKV